MFGKKNQNAGGIAEAGKPKEKPMSPRDALIDKLTLMAPGQEIVFRLAPMYGPELVVVEVGKDSHDRPRYAVATAEASNGKPGQKRNHVWDSGNAKSIAAWIITRDGKELA
jgi:hypothetical protein